MVVWSVWLLEFCIGAMVLLYGNHRKLYDMKVEKGWIGSSLFNAAAYLLVVSGIDGNGWISTGVLVIYCIMETIPAAVH